jgi:hypothetical protein
MYYSSHQVFKLHVNLHELTSCTLLHTCRTSSVLLQLTACFGILLTYTDLARKRITENTCRVIATQTAHWSAGYCIATVSARTYRKRMSRDRYILCDVTAYAPVTLTQREHRSSTVGRVLRALHSNEFTCHNICI